MASPSAAPRTRSSTRTAVDTDDLLLSRSLELAAWARRHAKIVSIVSAVSAAILLGLIYYFWMFVPQRAERAAVQLATIERANVFGATPQAERDLKDFIRRFDGTPEADIARLTLARQYLEGNRAAQAVPVLREVDAGVTSPVGGQAALLIGVAQAQSGNAQAAISSYLETAEAAKLDYIRGEALSRAALLREQANDFRGAAALWRQLADAEEEGSPQRGVFEMRATEAAAKAPAR